LLGIYGLGLAAMAKSVCWAFFRFRFDVSSFSSPSPQYQYPSVSSVKGMGKEKK